ncbi:PIN domain-containing protein [Anaerosalibacter sp. Marseille-P3206]|uniref:PIN domain-containing protein n=1 Tax=Anaerosalibacter sp. Marseille-P3206 TaxID=1871005 RepID=UPI000985BEFC|nr:PIN domain-containing protein [Anaerosalibacter sp. Marseille-P3206]
MGDKPLEDEKDIFVYNKIYSDIEGIFKNEFKELDNIKDDCLIVIDTNVLLLPYTIGKSTLEAIKNVYEILSSEKRLIIPGQVAREFAKNRPIKLCEIIKQLLDKKSKIPKLQNGKYPLLEEFEEYKKILDLEKQIDDLLIEYKKNLDTVVDNIKTWNWNDPVSLVYNEFFTKDCLMDTEFEEKDILNDLENRYRNDIPPGYKDASKKDKRIGDLLVWKTILRIGREREKDIIFVSGDVKADWWHQSNGQNIYPRYELIYEFKRYTGGKTLHIIEFSTLLNLFNASPETVKEVKNEEDKNKKDISVFINERKVIPEIICDKIQVSEKNNKRYDKIANALWRKEVLRKMIDWFYENYEDPANCVPYDSREGGYQYFLGGPYDPYEVLCEKFYLYDETLIEKAANLIYQYGCEWVKKGQY